MMDLDDTICALSSAPGRAGLAVVRVSGPQAFPLLESIFRPHGGSQCRDRRATLGRILDPGTEEELDQALVTCFAAPSSYTGEDVAEMSLHGSPVLVEAVLGLLCRRGARLASPGEFTMRAFLRGRMDLAQAEAVRDIVEATTLFQVRQANRQRAGMLSREVKPLKEALVGIIVQLESAVEFGDEGLVTESNADIQRGLRALTERIRDWIDSYQKGRIVRDGFRLAIVGRPNAGKSSLFNSLLSKARAIVTEHPGTTRDFIAESMSMAGIPVQLLDTAGIRATEDQVESQGVRRSYEVAGDADALLMIVDRNQAPAAEDHELKGELLGQSGIVVLNKSDLTSCWPHREIEKLAESWPWVEVSATRGDGMAELRELITQHLMGGGGLHGEGMLITNLRHCRCLEKAEGALSRASAAVEAGLSEEYVLVDLHVALQQLGEITGQTSVEEILGEIFSKFCIGK